MSTGKGTFLMSKEFRINGPFRNSTTVYSDIMAMFAGTFLMDDLWKRLLTRSAFS